MITATVKIISELVEHPRVGAIGFIFAVTAAAIGYAWGNDTFATTQQMAALESSIEKKLESTKDEIITDVNRSMVQREINLTEDSIRKITQQISLGLCADPECRFNSAEKEVLERRVESLKSEINQ